MKTAVFWGCCILTSQYAYEMSLRQVLPKFDIDLVEYPCSLKVRVDFIQQAMGIS